MATGSRSNSQEKGDACGVIQRSIIAYRGKLTGVAGRADMTLGMCGDQSDEKMCVNTLPLVKELLDKFCGFYDIIMEKFTELEALDPTNASYKTEKQHVHVEYAKVYGPLCRFVSTWSKQDEAQASVSAASESTGSEMMVARMLMASSMQDHMKPGVLDQSMTPSEYRQWELDFRNYYVSTQMDKQLYEVQVQMLVAALSPALKQACRTRFQEETDVIFGDTEDDVSCMSILRAHFMCSYPLIDRRATFWEVRHAVGQGWSDFCAKVRSLAMEAELQPNLPADEVIAMVMINGIRHKKLLERILNKWGSTNEIPSPADIEREGNIFMQTLRTSGRMLGGEQGRSSRDHDDSRKSHHDNPDRDKECRKCFQMGHIEKRCKNRQVCRHCKKPGFETS